MKNNDFPKVPDVLFSWVRPTPPKPKHTGFKHTAFYNNAGVLMTVCLYYLGYNRQPAALDNGAVFWGKWAAVACDPHVFY